MSHLVVSGILYNINKCSSDNANRRSIVITSDRLHATGRKTRCLVLLMCILTLPGCSGCQQSPATPPPPVKEARPLSPASENSSPPSEKPEAEDRPPNAAETQSTGATGTEQTSAEEQGTANASQGKSSDSAGGSRLGAAPREPAGTRSGAATNQTSGSGSGGKVQSAGEALETVQGLRQLSRQAAGRKDYGKAFELNSKAWEVLRPFSKDVTCAAVSSELEAELDRWGEQANAAVRAGGATSKRLVEK